jgi:hypothetical protein
MIPKLLDSSFTHDLYKQFIMDHADYAKVVGYNLTSDRGVREAIAGLFLYKNFLAEQCSYS